MTFKNPRYEGAPTGQFVWTDNIGTGFRYLRQCDGTEVLTAFTAFRNIQPETPVMFVWGGEGTRNLFEDAAINAEKASRVEELEEENERLKSECTYLESFIKDGKMFCQNCPQTQGRNMIHWSEWDGDVSETLTLEVPSKDYDGLLQKSTELAALKTKYTPRPMSEAPRDEKWFYIVYENGELEKCYYTTYLVCDQHNNPKYDENDEEIEEKGFVYYCENCELEERVRLIDLTKVIGFLPAGTFKGSNNV